MHPDRELPDIMAGSLIELHGRLHRLLAHLAASDSVLACDLTTHHIFLLQSECGDIGLPTRSDLARMLRQRTARMVSDLEAKNASVEAERLRIELSLLDEADVPNGTKAIAIWLHGNWTEELSRGFGRHDDPATIKRWRTARRKLAHAGASAATAERSRDTASSSDTPWNGTAEQEPVSGSDPP